MIFHLRRGVVLLTLAFAASGASALGFGAIPGSAVLGMPLDLRVPLRLEPGEDVNADCLSAQVQFGESLQTPGTVAVRLDPAVPGLAERVIRIQTTTRVNEPVVTIDLSAGCVSRIARTLTLFADPPLVPMPAVAESQPSEIGRGGAPSGSTGQAAAPASSASAPPPGPSAHSSASLAQAQPAGAAVDGAPPRKAQARRPAPPRTEGGLAEATPRSASGRTSAQAAPSTSASAPAPRKAPAPLAKPRAEAASAAVAAATPRLRLSTLEEGAAARPSATLAAAEAASAAEAAANAMMAASAAEAAAAARTAELEAASQKLRAEVERTQRQINELNAKLREVESGSQGEPLIVYLLGGLVLLLSGALWFMWRQREQDKRASSWMDQPVAAGPESLLRGSSGRGPVGPASQPLPLSGDEAAAPQGLPKEDTSDSRSGVQSEFDSVFAPLGRPRRSVSVEELIDLEQQAEFFIVLGQDEAAIELLTSHLGSSSDASPLPYLKLLEIFKRRGERSDYERLRERFNRHFAGNAPDWETDLQGGRSLPDYPETMERLERLWASPKLAMEMLQTRLLRDLNDESQTDADRQAFDLPAYRELMLLYSIARDLAETVGQAGVPDIALPLEIASPATRVAESGPVVDMPPISGLDPLPAKPDPAVDSVFGQLLATVPVEPQPQATQTLSIDLSLDEIETWPSVDPSATKRPGQDRGA